MLHLVQHLLISILSKIAILKIELTNHSNLDRMRLSAFLKIRPKIYG